jgi:hypothetical protein
VRTAIAVLALALAADPGRATIDLGVRGRANATPSIAASGDLVAVVWGASTLDGSTDVYAAFSRDAGRSFGVPVRVNDAAGDARLSGEQPPRVAIDARAVTVVWTSKGARGTVLKQARSTDQGRTFSRSTIVPGSDAAGNRGWHAVAVDQSGRVDAIWLDHRELAADASMATAHHEHGGAAVGKPDGVAMAQKSKLYVSSLDSGAQPRAIAAGVCYCCKTALAAGGNGGIFAAWRHVYPGNLRDIAFAASHDRGKSFGPIVRVSEDKWMLEGCPDDGPAMAIDAHGRIHVVWPTLVTGSAGSDPAIALFYAASADGTTFSARERVAAEGMPHHPTLAIAPDGSPTVAWDESSAGRRRAVLGRISFDRSGHLSMSRTVVSGADAAIYPVVATAGGAMVIAWTSGGGETATIRVARIE